MRAGRALLALGTLLGLALSSLGLAVALGEQPLSLSEALKEGTTDAAILWRLRLPRAALAGIVGAALAASGCTLQGLTRNVLADPFVLGVSGGAGLGATLALALGLESLGQGSPFEGVVHLSAPAAFAFAGALLATALVLTLGRAAGGSSMHGTLLAGVIFNAFALAAITFVKALAAPERLGDILYWLAGAIAYERPSTLWAAAALEASALLSMWALSGRLNLLLLGDEDASALGVAVERTRMALFLAASLAVAVAVALAGLVGFVGLIVPHLLRLALGPDQRLLLPASAIGGAAFLLLSDLAARLLFRVFGAEPPVGVLTALLGGPLFLMLLRGRPADGR